MTKRRTPLTPSGAALDSALKIAGWSRADLAEKLGKDRKYGSSISHMIYDDRVMEKDTADRIAKILEGDPRQAVQQAGKAFREARQDDAIDKVAPGAKPRESVVDKASRAGRAGTDAYYQAGLWLASEHGVKAEPHLFEAAIVIEAMKMNSWRRSLAAVRKALPAAALETAEKKLRDNIADSAALRHVFRGELVGPDIAVEDVASREWILLECKSPRCPRPRHLFWDDTSAADIAHCPLNGDPETHPDRDVRKIGRGTFKAAEGA